MLKSLRLCWIDSSSSAVMWTCIPHRYLMISPFLTGIRAVIDASCVATVYLFVVVTSKAHSGRYMLTYRLRCCRKSSFSLVVFKLSENFFRPARPRSCDSACVAFFSTITHFCRIAVTSSSLMPRHEWYALRFFLMFVQKKTYRV